MQDKAVKCLGSQGTDYIIQGVKLSILRLTTSKDLTQLLNGGMGAEGEHPPFDVIHM